MSCLRRARGAGRTKPPEEHYAEAESSSGRWTKAFPARRILFPLRRRQSRHLRSLEPPSSLRLMRPGPWVRPFYLSVWPRASAGMRSSTWCEKKRPQFATSSLPGPLTASESATSVRLAPSTERPRLRVSPRGSRFGGGQSEDRTKASPARCISVWTDVERHGRSRSREESSRQLSTVRKLSELPLERA